MHAARGVALVAALALGAPSPASAGSPEVDYMLHCQGCHLADGSGKAGAVPDLRGLVGEFLGVPGGRAYLVRVPGSAMAPLDDAGLAGVLNWIIRTYASDRVAARFDPFSAQEVARYRDPPLADVEAVRSALLEEIRRRRAASP